MYIIKGIVYEGIKDVRVEKVEAPKIQHSEDIIIKLTSTAICGSDIHLINGRVPNLKKGSVLGHETMRIVEEVGNI